MSSVTYSRLLNPLTFLIFFPICLLQFLFYNHILSIGLDPLVLIVGNILLYLITAAALYFHWKGFMDKNPNVFFRSVYGSMLMRMVVCIIAVVMYALIVGSKLNKYSLLICFLFYFLYSFVEVRRVLVLLKKKSDG
jgi:hypothetical protein